MTTTPRAEYVRTTRDWVLALIDTPRTYWTDETGEVRHFLTAQDAYDAHAAEHGH